ncbi:MAG: hypothetical protein IPJ65_26200 [Archangiaceae bacterium]|nr:hypothetical protein [Archangiaceae bacterium]
MRPALFVLLLTACFQPVAEGLVGNVTQCRGACPSGQCSDCAPVEASCHSPECELERYACSKETPCDAYDGVEHLPASSGAYCVTFDHDGGTWAVDSSGRRSACTPPSSQCDGGTPRDAGACAPCFRKTYCIGG